MFSSRKSAAPSTGYLLTKSLRFRSSASAYLNRTPASAGNQKTWTWSAWIKRGSLTTPQWLFAGGVVSTDYTFIRFGSGGNNNDNLEYARIVGSAVNAQKISTAVYRDTSAWYHIVVTEDAANTVSRVYVNGSEITYSTNTNPTNSNGAVNAAVIHNIGRYTGSNIQMFDGYMAEVHLIDGQALTPSSFGETSAATGVWQPIKYTGTYGTNGFYLPFTDTTSTSTLGTDFSGNSNTWTVNNISLTSGSTYDSMTDVPTLTSATTANYCVLNPLDNVGLTVSGGNLNLSLATATWYSMRASMAFPSTGKYYWEHTVLTGYNIVGILNASGSIAANQYVYTNQYGYGWQSVDFTKGNNNVTSYYGSAASNGDVLMLAFDADNRSLFLGKNGTWFNSSNPATNTSPMYSSIPTTETFFPTSALYATATSATNFGQRPFAYTPPTGFVALNTFNLSTPTIGATASTQANRYFDVVTRNGFGSSGGSVTSLNFQPDFWWEKARNTVSNHTLIDSIRGVTKELYSNLTNAESTGSNFLVSFNSNGFTMGSNDWGTSTTLVDWVWKANGSGSSNTAGSITSTVSANTTAGFSIVTYTGNGSAGSTVGHGLGVAPSMIIVKKRNTATSSQWTVGFSSLGWDKYILLNTTGASATDSNVWNSTPTSSVFYLGNDTWNNGSTNTYVAYCFAQVAGYSAFGSYTGNGSADGTFVFTGFRPRFLMYKRTDTSGSWVLIDAARGPYNVINPYLLAESSGAEDSANIILDFLSNGFKQRNTFGASNASGGTYIYMAFAEFPFRYSLAR